MRFSITVLVLVTLLHFQATSQNCLPGWLYTMPVGVSHTSNTPLFQFQVRVEINTSVLIAAGKMQPNGNDIRFVSSFQCCKQIPFYIESGINTANTVIWLRTDSLPINTSATYIMYYGNDTASGKSNPVNVFEWYEGFNNTSSKFSLACTSGNAIETQLGGKHTFSWQQYGIWVSDSTFGLNKPFTAEAKVDTFTGTNAGIYWLKSGKQQGYGIQSKQNGFVTTVTEPTDSGYCEEQVAISTPVTSSQTKIWTMTWVKDSFQQASLPGLPPWPTNDTSVSKNQPLKLCIGGPKNGTGSFTLDWIRVRKWFDPPPFFVIGNESPNPQPNFLGPDQTVCFGQMVTFDASGNGLANYSWSNSSADPAITVGSPGLYNVTSYLHNCLVFDYITLNVNPLPTIEAFANPTAMCSGDTALLTVSGGTSYLWQPVNISNDSAFVSLQHSGNLVVTGTDTNGCSKTDTVLLQIATPELHFPDSLRGCGALLLDAANPGSTYLWNNNSVNQTITVNTSGKYWVQVTSSNLGCVNGDTAFVQIFTPPQASFVLPFDTVCSDASALNLTGGLPFGGFYEGPGVNGDMFIPSNAPLGTNHIIYVFTDINGCSDTALADVTTELCLGTHYITFNTNNIYPNPANSNDVLHLASNVEGKIRIEVYTTEGQKIQDLYSENGFVKLQALDEGLYLIRIWQVEKMNTQKLIISN